MSWKRLVAALLVLMSLFPGVALTAENPRPEAGEISVIVDGKPVTAEQGTVIATGNKSPEGECEIGRVQARGHVSQSVPASSITLGVDETCQLIVKDIETWTASQGPPSPSEDGRTAYAEPEALLRDDTDTSNRDFESQSNVVYYHGWAQTNYEEQFEIDVTKVHAGMDYTDDGMRVLSGRNPDAWCWWRSGTGWQNLACGPYIWSTSGPDNVLIENLGEFDNPVGPHHNLWTRYEGYPGHSGYWTCDHWGSDPPGWNIHCLGGMDRLN